MKDNNKKNKTKYKNLLSTPKLIKALYKVNKTIKSEIIILKIENLFV